jgi:hypothetical protein
MFLIMQQRYNEQSDYQKPTSTSEAKVERDHSKDVLKIHSSYLASIAQKEMTKKHTEDSFPIRLRKHYKHHNKICTRFSLFTVMFFVKSL